MTVDGSRGIAETVNAVEHLFGGTLAAGPRARTLGERRALLREANEGIAAQVRSYYNRPWAIGSPETVVREFVCECGDPACTEDVRLAVSELGARAALAPGHCLEAR